MEKIRVRNCGEMNAKRKFQVIRLCKRLYEDINDFWFYGSYDDIIKANNAAREIGNGYVVPTEYIETA